MKTGSSLLLAVALLLPGDPAAGAPPRVALPGSASPLAREALDLGPLPRSVRQRVVVSLELRNRDGLKDFLEEVQDPRSPIFHQFLTQEAFNARYAPTPAEERAVVDHLRNSGLAVTRRFPNRLLVEATGNVAAIEHAFGVRLHAVLYKGVRRYAALAVPSLPDHLASYVVGVIGLDNLSEMRPRARVLGPVAAPKASQGGGCCSFSPNDLHTFYNNSTAFDGTGQTMVIAGAYAWKESDNTAFNNQWGLPQLPAGSAQVCTGAPHAKGCKFNNKQSIEIALDVEYAHGTAPHAKILNYMAASTLFTDFAVMYNLVVIDNPGHVVSTSWGNCEALVSSSTQTTNDNIFANANAVGQSWFAASGDDGSRDCNDILTVDHPANSPHVIGVGGTSASCSSGMTSGDPACGGYGSEVGWSGSGGGISNLFFRPSFQGGCGIQPGAKRLVPDVALEAASAPGNYVIQKGTWWIVWGTSGAAPQWAGFYAMLNQKLGGSGLGNPGAALYALCGTNALNDITSGSNGDYNAGPGYDLVTGLGTIDVDVLIPPLDPPDPPDPPLFPALSLRGFLLFLVISIVAALGLGRSGLSRKRG